MKDNRTLKEKIESQNKYRLELIPLGFSHKGDWDFTKNGKEYDFSATDLEWIKNKFKKEREV